MNLDDNNKYELLDNYLSGGMNADDIDKFRAFLQSDADLAMDHQIVAEITEAKEFTPQEAALRATLSSIKRNSATDTDLTPQTKAIPEPTVTVPKKSKTRYLYTAIAMAASLVLLFSIFLPQMSNNSTSYGQYAMIEPLDLTTKGAIDDLTLTTNLQEAYNSKDYAKALPQIEAYLAAAPKDMDVLLAKGISLTELEKYSEAHQAFAHIKSLRPRLKKYQWFDAQCHLKEGNLEQAKALLMDLVATKAYNHKQAQKLLATFE